MCTNSENIPLQRAGFGEINFGPLDTNLVKPCFYAFYFLIRIVFFTVGIEHITSCHKWFITISRKYFSVNTIGGLNTFTYM